MAIINAELPQHDAVDQKKNQLLSVGRSFSEAEVSLKQNETAAQALSQDISSLKADQKSLESAGEKKEQLLRTLEQTNARQKEFEKLFADIDKYKFM